MRISDWSSDVCSSDLVPGRWQAAVESVYGFIDNTLSANVGPEGRRFVPLIFSLFMFIIVANFAGLLPVGVVPGVHAFTVTSHVTVTAMLALISFATVLFEIGRASCRERVCQYV